MRCIVTAMRRLLLLLVPLSFAQADCETPSGLTQSCDSKVQTATYNVAGACGASGILQITVPVAGQCEVGALGNQAIGIPTNGNFNGDAQKTGFDLTQGNWNLQSPPTGTQGDNSGTNCLAGAANDAGDITLECTVQACTPSGDGDDTYACTMVECPKHLTPAPAGAMPDLDAGTTEDAGTSADAG